MKSGIICGTLLSGIAAVEVGEKVDGERRYDQLTDMMAHYNADFDERKYWAYGCHCLILGDRPMSDMGKGKPIDALDSVCKAYKECLKCARLEYGDSCIGEFYRYDFKLENNGGITCKDNPVKDSTKACKRKLCECDAMFAKAHVGQKDVFNKDYHQFWTTIPGGFNTDTECVSGGGNNDPQCCGVKTGPSVLYNANRFDCCSGQKVPLGQC